MSHLDAPEYQGLGNTQMHDAAIAAGLVPTPKRYLTHDEIHLQYQVQQQQEIELRQGLRGDEEESENEDEDDDDFLHQLARKRLEKIRSIRTQQQYQLQSKVLSISGEQFDGEVVVASRHGWVMMLIDRPNCDDCHLLFSIYVSLSISHPHVKFVRLSAADNDIVNFPLSDCPAVLAYYKGRKQKQWATLMAFKGHDTNQQVIEREMQNMGIIDTKDENHDYLDDS